MGWFRGRGGAGNLLSRALSFLLVVIFWLLFMATTVTARLLANVPPSVSSPVQEPLLTDEVAALKEIASALNRNAELFSNSWIKVGLLSFGVLFVIEIVKIKTGIYTGVRTQYLVDRQREAIPQGGPLAASANPVATTTADADREENQTNCAVDRLVEGLESVEPNRRDNLPHWPRVETEASTEKGKDALNLIEERGHQCCLTIGDGSRFPDDR